MRAVVLLAVSLGVMCGASSGHGLTAGKDGTVLRDGRPYHGIGVNYMDAFTRTLVNGEDTSYREGFERLAERGIPFARLNFSGFYPVNWKLYFADRDEYFRRMDGVVKTAEETGVGLIPSLHFASCFVCDMVGEPRSAWGDPDSKAVAFMRQYVKEVVTRYRDSEAIWAWEFANEFSLGVDLPNAADARPPIAPEFGTATSRSAADDLTHEMMVTAFREFGQAVRDHDKTRLVTHGASMPRPAAEHLRASLSWTHDSREEFQKNLADCAPDPIDLVSVHLYPFDKERFGRKDIPYDETLRLAMEACRRMGKPLFVGEFGAIDDQTGSPQQTRVEFEEMVQALVKNRVPLSAVWVFDFAHQDGTCNITPNNNRSYMLDMVSEANRRITAAPAAD